MKDLEIAPTQDKSRTVVLRLRDMQRFWSSPDWVAPDWLDNADHVGKVLSQLTGDAADLIEAYEAEVASLERMPWLPSPMTND